MPISEAYHIDCIEYMKTIPDKFFDLAVVDPPYFEEYGKMIYPGAAVSTTGIKRNRYSSKHWDVPGEDYFNELYRISKNQIIWGINYYEQYANNVGRIVWDKVNDESSFSKCEIAMKSFGISVDIFRYKWNGMLQQDMKNKEERIHPTQKPVALYTWTFQKFAKQGDKIFDSHMGSQSSRIAAYDIGFDYWGCELDADYFRDGCARFDQHRTKVEEVKELGYAKTQLSITNPILF